MHLIKAQILQNTKLMYLCDMAKYLWKFVT